jgi:hypothetical protein
MDNATNVGAPVAVIIFPVLKPAEIQQCLQNLGTDLTQEEIQDPAHHKKKLRKVFAFLVRMCKCIWRRGFLCKCKPVLKFDSFSNIHVAFFFSARSLCW